MILMPGSTFFSFLVLGIDVVVAVLLIYLNVTDLTEMVEYYHLEISSQKRFVIKHPDALTRSHIHS